MQFKYLTVIQPVCRLAFQDGFPVFAAAMNPEHMAESGHRITRPEFPDYRELFRSLTSRAR